MELWDAYDQDFKRIGGVTLVRGEPVPEGLFHLVCEILVRHTDGSYLLMQRDWRKNFGGMWEASAGGSALQNETPLACAIRELREETGIRAENIVEVGRVKGRSAVYAEFFCITNCDKDSITLQEGETIAFRWVSRDELAAMKKSELLTSRIQQFIEDLQTNEI